MQIRTSVVIKAPSENLWPLLTNSRMDVSGCFCLGVPRPVACELPHSKGGIGSERRCISDRGTVIQKITEWKPSERLQFKMISTNHGWGPWVESIEENFQLQECDHGTRITRTTDIRARGPFRSLKELGFYFGLKRVHFYVFKNWRSKAEQGAAVNP